MSKKKKTPKLQPRKSKKDKPTVTLDVVKHTFQLLRDTQSHLEDVQTASEVFPHFFGDKKERKKLATLLETLQNYLAAVNAHLPSPRPIDPATGAPEGAPGVALPVGPEAAALALASGPQGPASPVAGALAGVAYQDAATTDPVFADGRSAKVVPCEGPRGCDKLSIPGDTLCLSCKKYPVPENYARPTYDQQVAPDYHAKGVGCIWLVEGLACDKPRLGAALYCGEHMYAGLALKEPEETKKPAEPSKAAGYIMCGEFGCPRPAQQGQPGCAVHPGPFTPSPLAPSATPPAIFTPRGMAAQVKGLSSPGRGGADLSTLSASLKNQEPSFSAS